MFPNAILKNLLTGKNVLKRGSYNTKRLTGKGVSGECEGNWEKTRGGGPNIGKKGGGG